MVFIAPGMTKKRIGHDISLAAMDSTTAAAANAVQAKHGIKPVTAHHETKAHERRRRMLAKTLYARQNGAPYSPQPQRPPQVKRKAGMQCMGGIVAAIVKDITRT